MPDYALEDEAGGRVAGVDEAGRGPLAGPVVAAVVVFHTRPPAWLAELLDDSKRLDPARRQLACAALLGFAGVDIAVGAASVEEIERINILRASLLAMRRAVARLAAAPDLALVDGNQPPGLACVTRCVVDGDARCLSIAAASIIAKVTRDRGMTRLAARFPQYGWHSNAGYGTPGHRAALLRHGPTVHHRSGFGLVREIHARRAEAAELPPLHNLSE